MLNSTFNIAGQLHIFIEFNVVIVNTGVNFRNSTSRNMIFCFFDNIFDIDKVYKLL